MKIIKTKIQIFNKSQSAFGPGKADLLVAISHYGSISAAAKSMNMSYKRAWNLVTTMNEVFQQPLVTTQIGGSHGGGATVTPFGQNVLRLYQYAINNSERYIDAQMSDLLKLLN